MVLVDRWREIARCSCRFEVTSSKGLDVIARGHAEFWAPTARVAYHPEEAANRASSQPGQPTNPKT
jgi:hypothetical protein